MKKYAIYLPNSTEIFRIVEGELRQNNGTTFIQDECSNMLAIIPDGYAVIEYEEITKYECTKQLHTFDVDNNPIVYRTRNLYQYESIKHLGVKTIEGYFKASS